MLDSDRNGNELYLFVDVEDEDRSKIMGSRKYYAKSIEWNPKIELYPTAPHMTCLLKERIEGNVITVLSGNHDFTTSGLKRMEFK